MTGEEIFNVFYWHRSNFFIIFVPDSNVGNHLAMLKKTSTHVRYSWSNAGRTQQATRVDRSCGSDSLSMKMLFFIISKQKIRIILKVFFYFYNVCLTLRCFNQFTCRLLAAGCLCNMAAAVAAGSRCTLSYRLHRRFCTSCPGVK